LLSISVNLLVPHYE